MREKPRRPATATDASTVIDVRVLPRASRCEILDPVAGRLRIRTTAAPSDGNANRDVARQLARAYEVPVSRVALIRGASSRDKRFRITGPYTEPDFSTTGRKPN
jgi:uncharacterized protein YggU (UPF0235/DUF167 family)